MVARKASRERRAAQRKRHSFISDEQQHRGGTLQWLRWRFFSHTAQAVDLQILKHGFIVKHKLPANFDFERYLAHSLEDAVGSTLHISMTTWFVLLFLSSVTFVVFERMRATEWQLAWSFVSLGWGMLAVQITILVLALRARRLSVELNSELEPEDCSLARLAQRAINVMPPDKGSSAARKAHVQSKYSKRNPVAEASASAKHPPAQMSRKLARAMNREKEGKELPRVSSVDDKGFLWQMMHDFDKGIIRSHWDLVRAHGASLPVTRAIVLPPHADIASCHGHGHAVAIGSYVSPL